MHVDLNRRPRTRLAFSDADMVRLRDLYYDRDVPMVKVAGAFGVSASTLYHWIAEMDWPRRSAQFPIRTNPRADAAGDATGARTPAGTPEDAPAREGPTGPSVGDERFAAEVASAARRELHALGSLAGPVDPGLTLVERGRRANLIASLSRSIARVDRVFEARVQVKALQLRVKQLEKALAAKEAAPLAALERMVAQRALQLAQTPMRTAPPPRVRATPAKTGGGLTRPEYRQWWIDRGEEPP